MIGPLQFEFMRTAYLAAMIVGLVAPLVGLLLVERRMSLIGDGLGHVAFAGVGLGIVLGVEPVFAALVVAVLGAIAIEWIRARRLAAGDRALALLFYAGLATGVVLISSSSTITGNINSYLFGSILTISAQDLATTALVGVVVLAVVGFGWRAFVASAIDEEGAFVRGVPVRMLNLIVAVLAAATVAASIRTVGVLLVGALMVLPVMSGALIARSLRSTAISGSLLGAVMAAGGLTLAYYADLAPGGTIVCIAAATYALLLVVRAFGWRRA
jgi:zinc transport system permease protein